MKHQVFTLSVLFVLLSVFAYGQEKEVNAEGNYKHLIRVKIAPQLTAKFDALHQKSGHSLNEITAQSKSQPLNLGIQELDTRNTQYGAYSYKRVFRYAGKFEQRHRKFGLHRWYEIRFNSKVAVNKLVEAYAQSRKITVANAVPRMQLIGNESTSSLSGDPNDPQYPDQWHYNNTGQTGGTTDADIDLPEAWETETGNSNVIVAIEDQGVDYNHEDLAGNMWTNDGETPGNGVDDDNNGYVDDYYGYNFGDNQGAIEPGEHGTHVAGTVAGETNNGTGVAGVAGGSGSDDGVRLMSAQVFGANSQGGFDEAFVYAADMGAHVSQNSWGGGGEDQAINDAIDYFIANGGSSGSPMEGGVVAFAAGNSDVSSGSSTWPAQYASAIAVASTDHNDVKSSFSNYGSWVDISAPGSDILSCQPNNSYQLMSGTSMACPHVSGAAALVISAYAGNITPSEVRNRLESYADPIDNLNPGYEGQLGSGRLNAYAAVTGETPPEPPQTFCSSQGEDASYEWISQVQVGSYSNSSSGAGYTDFTSETVPLEAGQSYSLTLTPGFSGSTYNEYWKIWIDYNNDTAFTSDELAFDAGSLSDTEVTGTLSVPSDASGTVRMRVTMKYNGEPGPCETFSYGEVEDYNAEISSGSSDTNPPTVPTGLSASGVTETSFTLSWSASSDEEGTVEAYEVYKDGALEGTTSTTSYDLSGLQPATSYSMTVKAVDDAGNVSDASSALSVTTLEDTEAPTAPANLAASNVTSSSVDLSWDASSDNIGVTGYEVYKDGNFEASTTNTAYSVTGLSPETAYTFTVKAKDAAGNLSAASNSADVTTSEESLSYCTSQGNDASYEWISQVQIGNYSNSSSGAGYTDFTSETVPLEAGKSYSLTLTPGFSGSTYNEYWKIWIDYNADGTFGTDEVAFDAGSLSDTEVTGTLSVPSDVSGSVRMRISMKYNGEPSPCESFTYGEVEDYTADITAGSSDTNPPSVPTGLSASNVTETSFTLSWNASSDTEGSVASYEVYKDGVLEGTTSNTSYSLSGLQPATSYSMTVKAVDDAGNTSDASSALSVTTLEDTESPTAPANLTASNVTSSAVDLSWDASSDNIGVTGYEVYKDGALEGTTSNTAYAVSGLSPSTSYSFTVKALDAAGNLSAASNSVSVTTDAEDLSYCTSKGNNSSYEWIDLVELGGMSNSSGDDGGYADYTGQVASVTQGASATIYFSAGFSWSSYTEYWHVWIDFDRSGSFESDERVVYGSSSSSDKLQSSFTVPSDALLGETRMRVTMKYNGEASPCETYTYGETEDYTVNVVSTSVYQMSAGNSGAQLGFESNELVTLYPNPAAKTLNLNIRSEAETGKLYNSQGVLIRTFSVEGTRKTLNISDLAKGSYYIRIEDPKAPIIKPFIKH